MFLASTNNLGDMVNLGIGEAGLIALTGYLVVFIGLILLMIIVIIMGKIMVAAKNKQNAKAEAVVVPAAAAAEPVGEPAPGTAGEVKLYDVPDKEAAMIMAIVANKMQKPLNELRFKSIKEVK